MSSSSVTPTTADCLSTVVIEVDSRDVKVAEEVPYFSKKRMRPVTAIRLFLFRAKGKTPPGFSRVVLQHQPTFEPRVVGKTPPT